MTSLEREPPQPVQSLDELFAIAHAMEDEAASRYAEIAQRMRREGDASLAEVFERLSAEERGHIESVTHWSERERGRAPDPALVRWRLPETFDDEGAATTDPRLLTAYRSLAMAVRNEERAFAFWSYVVAHATRPEIRRAAEAMALEELNHVAALRRERRRLYHIERSSAAQRGAAPAPEQLERRLADGLRALAASAEPDEAARLRPFEEEARRTAEELAREPIPVSGAARGRADPDDPVALSELLVDLYLEAAETGPDEEVRARAQSLAGRAIKRLAWLRADLPEIDRSRERTRPGG